MSKDTKIEWPDSTLNIQMGCSGCELWNTKKRTCYAGIQTRVYEGLKGWPKKFEQPEIFPDRLAPALRWPDLTGTQRPDKPWLNDWPRVVFLNDMGDTFDRKLARDWLLPFVKDLESWPAIIMFLTKRAVRQQYFFNEILGYVPHNFALGVSITAPFTYARLKTLRATGGPNTIRWLSIEPVLAGMDDIDLTGIDQAIAGGESGPSAYVMQARDVNGLLAAARRHGTAFFFKQWGVDAANPDPHDPTKKSLGGPSKGGAQIKGQVYREMFDYRKTYDPSKLVVAAKRQRAKGQGDGHH